LLQIQIASTHQYSMLTFTVLSSVICNEILKQISLVCCAILCCSYAPLVQQIQTPRDSIRAVKRSLHSSVIELVQLYHFMNPFDVVSKLKHQTNCYLFRESLHGSTNLSEECSVWLRLIGGCRATSGSVGDEVASHKFICAKHK